MEARIINFHQGSSVLPEQAIESFLTLFSSATTKEKLWQLFYLAVKGGVEEPGSPISPEEAALLIDQLTSLVTAVSIVHQDGRVSQTKQHERSEHE